MRNGTTGRTDTGERKKKEKTLLCRTYRVPSAYYTLYTYAHADTAVALKRDVRWVLCDIDLYPFLFFSYFSRTLRTGHTTAPGPNRPLRSASAAHTRPCSILYPALTLPRTRYRQSLVPTGRSKTILPFSLLIKIIFCFERLHAKFLAEFPCASTHAILPLPNSPYVHSC